MKIKVVKPIRISEVGKTVLPVDHECEVSEGAGKILINKGYAEEVGKKPPSAADLIEAIGKVENLEDLKPYAKDTRATVKKAYEDKVKELTPES